MEKKKIHNLQLGVFVLVGLAFLIAALYLIGNNRSLFDRTFQIKATFYQVNGLMKGNNVRFSGIDVGTVRDVQIVSDTSVEVTMLIENDAQRFIRKNALAAVGTDGLMGNKLVNIDNGLTPSEPVANGDVLKTLRPVDSDQMLRTLDQTNQNLAVITADLRKITQKVNSDNTLWSILMDTIVAANVKKAIVGLRTTTQNTATFTNDLNVLMQDIHHGKGLLGMLATDTSAAGKIRASLAQINIASEKAAQVTAELKSVTDKFKRTDGTVGVLLNDSTFAHDLTQSMKNIRISSEKLNENMEAMKHNFLFRGYFKKLEKEKAGTNKR